MTKEQEALDNFLKEYLSLCEKLHTNQQEKMLLDSNSPYNILKNAFEKAPEPFQTGIDLGVIKPKKYLKWEDLEKFKDKDSVKVKMNDTELSLIIQIDCLNDIYVQLYKEKEDGNCVNLLSDFFRNKELFNNLRLELLE